MIREARSADAAPIVQLAVDNDMFPPEEEPITASLQEHFAGASLPGTRWLVDVRDGAVAGAAYLEPRVATDRVWYLMMLAVSPDTHGQGVGRALMAHMEALLRDEGQRLLIIETSGLPAYERTRRFYAQCGYTQAAVVPDYFEDGDDMVLFSKDVRKVPQGG